MVEYEVSWNLNCLLTPPNLHIYASLSLSAFLHPLYCKVYILLRKYFLWWKVRIILSIIKLYATLSQELFSCVFIYIHSWNLQKIKYHKNFCLYHSIFAVQKQYKMETEITQISLCSMFLLNTTQTTHETCNSWTKKVENRTPSKTETRIRLSSIFKTAHIYVIND